MSAGRIIDYDDVAGRPVVRDCADVVIVGSGAAGSTAARVLSEYGLDVIIVEEGIKTPRDGFSQEAYKGFKYLWRDLGFQAAQGKAFTPILQGCALGGTTVVNGAIIHRLPEKIHRDWVDMGAIDQRLDYSKLQWVFDKLDTELSVAPAPEDILGKNNKLMRLGVKSIGAEGNVIRRVGKDCEGSARCNQGCPGGRKQAMHLTYLPRAVKNGARIYTRCRVEKVEIDKGEAKGVVARFRSPIAGHKDEGPTLIVEARLGVMVAASAIQTPVLLQKSGLKHPALGKHFSAHPGTGVLASFEQDVSLWNGVTQGFETTHFWADRMKMETVGVPLEILGARLPGFGRKLMESIANARHIAQWGVQVRAEAEGSVTSLMGKPLIRYDLGKADVVRFKKGVERITKMMFGAGAKQVFPGVHGMPEAIDHPSQMAQIYDLPDDPRLFHFIASHLFGTARMHADPAKGVVKTNGECHQVRRLYVIDSSIFPTNLGVNPQHSICGWAWRIAEDFCEDVAHKPAR